MDNATDPFNQPPANPKNSTNTNPNNQFANAGWGSTDDNDYLGNYGSPASCALDCTTVPAAPLANNVYYRVGWNGSDQRYHVYHVPRQHTCTQHELDQSGHAENAPRFRQRPL